MFDQPFFTRRALALVIIGFSLCVCDAPAQGKETVSPLLEEPAYLFNDGEVFLDLFGAVGNSDQFEIGDAAGGGVGFGHFFTRYTALYAEGYVLDAPDVDGAALGGLILRLPLDDFCLAFYVFGEYGATFGEETEGTFQFGGGIDVRLTDHVSFFADARSIQNKHTSIDNGEVFRIGLRLVF